MTGERLRGLRGVGATLPKGAKVLVVCGQTSFAASGADALLADGLQGMHVEHMVAPGSNPQIEPLRRMVREAAELAPDVIIAIGGGSVIDAAKILHGFMDRPDGLRDPIGAVPHPDGRRRFIAVPTTVGSGSEATQFAAVYDGMHKVSIDHPELLPHQAILDAGLVRSLPAGLVASTAFDALSQALESSWSPRADPVSMAHAASAVPVILSELQAGIGGDAAARGRLLRAAHDAGKAINLTRTTAPHAMSYALTTRFGVPHGHAVALTLGACIRVSAEVADTLPSQEAEVGRQRIDRVVAALGAKDPDDAEFRWYRCLQDAGLETHLRPMGVDEEAEAWLAGRVDATRLGNHPVPLRQPDLERIYHARA